MVAFIVSSETEDSAMTVRRLPKRVEVEKIAAKNCSPVEIDPLAVHSSAVARRFPPSKKSSDKSSSFRAMRPLHHNDLFVPRFPGFGDAYDVVVGCLSCSDRVSYLIEIRYTK